MSTPPFTFGWLATMPTARPDDDFPGEQTLDLEPRARVDDPVDHLVHVEVLALVVRHDLVDGAAGLRGGRLARGRQLAVRLRHVREVAARQLDRLLVGLGQHVAASGHLAVHERPAQRLERCLLADRHLDHARAADVERGLALDHDDHVGERRQVCRARRRGTEQDAHLRDHAGELDLVVEDAPGVEPAREDLDLLGDAPAGRVDHIEEGDPEPGRLFLDAHDLLDRLLAPRAGLDRVVVGHDADGTGPDRADAGDNAVGGRVGLDIASEQPVLLELGAGIEEELEPVAHEELALGPKLVAVAGVALLDPGAFLAVALLARAHRVVAPITAWGSSRG
jgi:hypothetical protein